MYFLKIFLNMIRDLKSVSLLSVCVSLSLWQVNGGEVKTLRKGLSLYHSETQLSQFQDNMHNVRTLLH